MYVYAGLIFENSDTLKTRVLFIGLIPEDSPQSLNLRFQITRHKTLSNRGKTKGLQLVNRQGLKLAQESDRWQLESA